MRWRVIFLGTIVVLFTLMIGVVAYIVRLEYPWIVYVGGVLDVAVVIGGIKTILDLTKTLSDLQKSSLEIEKLKLEVVEKEKAALQSESRIVIPTMAQMGIPEKLFPKGTHYIVLTIFGLTLGLGSGRILLKDYAPISLGGEDGGATRTDSSTLDLFDIGNALSDAFSKNNLTKEQQQQVMEVIRFDPFMHYAGGVLPEPTDADAADLSRRVASLNQSVDAYRRDHLRSSQSLRDLSWFQYDMNVWSRVAEEDFGRHDYRAFEMSSLQTAIALVRLEETLTRTTKTQSPKRQVRP